ncbi:biopolymer transporter ExbD [Chelativorans sp. AA-79]|uniref:biopolymer transporter ExbD n=1 Tax=Chelativorans sp. AA-79 TaxID=3028735 RepID=UPI0023F8AF47|nr:biopolymer transporter ExbD [Chelativorans sp. AA-79]WEX10859.1 hypothetical protein PVE73_07970 [Chelativorans sp. AA-79]
MSLIPPQRRRPKPNFSLTTVNIVFLLLLFYLAAGSLVSRGEVEADIPITRDLPLERLPRPLLLIAEGGLFLDGSPVPPGQAGARALAAMSATPGAAFVNLLAARTMPAGDFLTVVSAVQEAGVPVRVVTLHEGYGVKEVRP